MKRLAYTTKVILLGMALGLTSGTFAAEIEPGLDWQYKGSKHFDKALVIWTDDQAVGVKEWFGLIPTEYYDAQAAALMSREKTEELLKGNNPVLFKDIAAVATANYEIGTMFAMEAIPTNKIQRITHDGWIYVFGRTGWGFSVLANIDENGYVTEYAMNDVGNERIVSRLFATDGITIHSDDLKVNHFTTLGKEAFRPKLSAINLKHQEPATRGISAETEFTIISIDNAVVGHSYQVISTKNLADPFLKNEAVGIKKAEADGELTFEVPLDPNDKVHFYKIDLIE